MAKLTVNESTGDFTHVITLNTQDIINAGTTATAFASIPAGGGVDLCGVYEAEALSPGSNLTIDVGTTEGDPDEFINALDLDATVGPTYNSGESFVQASGDTTIAGGAKPVATTNSGSTVYYKFGGSVSSLTSGKIVIGLRIMDPARFA